MSTSVRSRWPPATATEYEEIAAIVVTAREWEAKLHAFAAEFERAMRPMTETRVDGQSKVFVRMMDRLFLVEQACGWVVDRGQKLSGKELWRK